MKYILYLVTLVTLFLFLGIVWFFVAMVYGQGSQGGIILGVFLDLVILANLVKWGIPVVKGVRF